MSVLNLIAWSPLLVPLTFYVRRWALLSDAREAVSASATVVWWSRVHKDAKPSDEGVALRIAAEADARLRDLEEAPVWRWSP